jgi:hypothetical protein
LFAFGGLCGGAISLATATLKNHSAAMLTRLGGRPLSTCGIELPTYFDPQYSADMTVLRFDTREFASRYAPTIFELRDLLIGAPVICPEALPYGHLAGLDVPVYIPPRPVFNRRIAA